VGVQPSHHVNCSFDSVKREKLYKFFMSLKEPDGSFLVTHHAEVDVRFVIFIKPPF
jgi:prenyltransferase beta subunit